MESARLSLRMNEEETKAGTRMQSAMHALQEDF